MKGRLRELLNKHWFANTFAACIAVILFMLLSHLYLIPILFRYISPVIWGILFAYLINPLVNQLKRSIFKRIKKEKFKHVISVILGIIIVLILFSLLIIAFVPPLIDSVRGIVYNIDSYAETIRNFLNRLSNITGKLRIDISSINSGIEKLIQGVVNIVSGNSSAIVQSFYDFGTSIANIAIGAVLAIYFLLDKVNLKRGINKVRILLLSDEAYRRNNIFWKKCHAILSRFLMFNILEGFIVGIANMIFMLICHMPYVALISIVVGITNLIPTIGPLIGGIIGGILLLLTNPISALLFIIFTIIIQIFDGSILKPKMFGDSFGVPSVWILVAIVLGGKFFGIIGVILAIPVAAICTYALNEMIYPILIKRKEESEKANDAE